MLATPSINESINEQNSIQRAKNSLKSFETILSAINKATTKQDKTHIAKFDLSLKRTAKFTTT